jgi:phage protein D/phage baseplate assembly protein gpV
MPREKRIDQIAIKVNGADLPRDLMDALLEVVVDSSLHLPDMFIIRVHDDELKWMDEGPFALGASVEIELSKERERTERVIAGEITAVEPDFSEGVTATFTARGYDRGHRLNRDSKTRVFVQATDSDIVQQIGSEAGLQVQTESTSEVYAHVFQHNQTDLAFLQERAERIGYEVFVDDRTLHFRRPRGSRGALSLEWGDTLRSFRPRLTLAGQVDEVTVKGWDPQAKREIVGQATSSDTAPQIDVGGEGGQVASRAFSSARKVVVRRPVASQSEADTIAQALLDEINAGFVEAEGVATRNPGLLAGNMVELTKLGKKFSGKYMVTSATHTYSAQRGYATRFTVEGARPTLMADLVGAHSPNGNGDGALWGGVVPAVVTNNNDPDNMGRLKLKFPWLDGDVESDWARVSAVGAGAERGLFWLPEVNDEVLVAFEHGDFGRPYVIGNLWNGQDEPPEKIDQAVSNGKVRTRTIKTRTGHVLRLVDDENGEQFIEIIDAAEATHIKLDAKSEKLTIECKGDVSIKADGSISLSAQRDIEIEASGDLKMKGRAVKVESDTGAEVTGGTSLKLKGAQFTAEGDAMAELKAGGNVVIKGALVQIN